MNPGIVYDLDESSYHADPALSSSRARRILESPALFRWMEDHPQAPKSAFDLGTAVHSKVLGTGARTVTIPDELLASNGSASTKDAKAFIEQARIDGMTPVKADVAAEVDAMTEAVLRHPIARELFEQPGSPEASVFATDPDTGVDMRARFDYLPDITASNPRAVDLKTTGKKADKRGFERTVLDWGYDVQDRWYVHALRLATGLVMPFQFVVVETAAPYFVAVHELDIKWQEMGDDKTKRALELYAACSEFNSWPGYPNEVQVSSPPVYALYQHEEQFS